MNSLPAIRQLPLIAAPARQRRAPAFEAMPRRRFQKRMSAFDPLPALQWRCCRARMLCSCASFRFRCQLSLREHDVILSTDDDYQNILSIALSTHFSQYFSLASAHQNRITESM